MHRTFVAHAEGRGRVVSPDTIERLVYALGVAWDQLSRPPKAPGEVGPAQSTATSLPDRADTIRAAEAL